MKSLVARYLRFVAVVCSVMLVALTVGCETEPEPVVSLTGTWTGLQDSAMDDRTLRWQLALVDLPPDSIWGSARWQIADAGPGWSLAQYLTGWRDGSSVVLEWGYRSQVKTRYEAEVSTGEDAPDSMTGSLFRTSYEFGQLSVEKSR